MSKTSLFTISLTFLLLLSACKGCKDPCDGVPCALGEMCVDGQCLPDSALCDPECGDDQVCQAGTCVDLEDGCTTAGDACDASFPAGDGFVCLDLDGFGPRTGVCVENCAPDGSCPSGALCFFVASAADATCETTADCEAGHECSDGFCLETICRPSECDSFLDGATTCSELYENDPAFAYGAQCYDVGNDARYCYPAGQQADGDACGDVIEAIVTNSFGATCASGLACVDDVCRTACKDDAACTGELECILASADFIDDGTGICGDGCEPFELGSCGDGMTCLPVSGEEGVCATAGDKEAFEPCAPGEGECADGLLCITYQADPQRARCQPICDLTVAPPNDDGSVGEFAQSQRDATCPQPPPGDAVLGIWNLAEIGQPVDVYLADSPAPLITGLVFEADADADPVAAGVQWLTITPGAQTVRVLPGGAATTDPPLAEQTINFVRGDAARLMLMPVAGALDEVALTKLREEVEPQPAGVAQLRVFNALVDTPSVDVILVPPGDDLSVAANQTELARGLVVGARSFFVDVPAGDGDVLVFAAGDARTDRLTALANTTVTATPDGRATLAVRGTADPDDTPNAGVTVFDYNEPPAQGPGGPSFWCVDVGGGPFGFCQQTCGTDPGAFAGGFCDGEEMGCSPTFLAANGRWASLCAPLGAKVLGDACDPFAANSECGEGLYCLEYGNTAPDFSSLDRGRCTSLCVETDANHPVLSCGAGQGCDSISSDPDYVIGNCGFSCDPDSAYSDTACPAGLQACKPQAELVDDPANPDAFPTSNVTASFCSASGDVVAGETCAGNDCEPGSECMFPRSAQNGFTSTLLSQYFGAAGLVPACHPQCDPFEGDSSMTTCASDETCLFNFPYSAEVGHCAPVSVELDPLQECSNPGEACGRDSICVVNAGAATCFQFCQYRGPDANGELVAESCAQGLRCAPLVNDIGICL